jgi:hypothetical protein
MVGLILVMSLQPVLSAQPKSPVAVRITTPEPTVKGGVEVRIDIAVKNISDQPTRILQSPTGHAEAINRVRAYDSKGNSLSLIGGSRHFISIKSMFLNPGASTDEFLILSKLFDLSRPDTYTVAVDQELQLDAPRREDRRLFVQSNTLLITVTE